jgi:hypothetical protein
VSFKFLLIFICSERESGGDGARSVKEYDEYQ